MATQSTSRHEINRLTLAVPAVVGLALLTIWGVAYLANSGGDSAVDPSSHGPRATDRRQGYFRPSGYYAVVNQLIAEGKIVLDREPHASGGSRFKVKVLEDKLTASEREWLGISGSRLKEDIARHNEEGDHEFFRRKGGGLAVNESYLRSSFEAAKRAGWSGDLTYRLEQPRPVISGWLATERSTTPVEILFDPVDRKLIPSEYRRSTLQRLTSGRCAGLAIEQGGPVLYLYRLGESVLLEVVRKSDLTIRLNGIELAAGKLLALQDLDVATIESQSPHVRLTLGFHSARNASLISTTRHLNGAAQRIWVDDAMGFTRNLAEAIDQSVSLNPTMEGSQKFQVELTIDRTLQTALQEALSREAAARYGTDETRRASVTVMDADSGELLALASWPPPPARPKVLEDREAVQVYQESARRWRNHNFVNHEIGSQIKPLVGAAAIERTPLLYSYVVRGYPRGTESSLFQFGISYSLHGASGGSDGAVDFNDFLKYSSNRYAVELGTLAASSWRPEAGLPHGAARGVPRYSIAGSSGDVFTPDLSSITRDGRSVENLHRTEFAATLAKIARVRTFFEEDGAEGQDDVSDSKHEVIAPLVEFLDIKDLARSPMLGNRFVPDSVNLGANQWQSLRGDMVSCFLGGGGRIRWSNVQLAESYARVVTNRPVEATLIRSIRDSKGVALLQTRPPERAALMADTAWRRITTAMLGAASSGGTAAHIAPTIDKWNADEGYVRYRLFSKTGTLEIFKPDGSGGFVPTGYNRSMYSAVLQSRGNDGTVRHLVFVVYLEDPRTSAVAVEFAATFIDDLRTWLTDREAEAR